MDAVMSVNSKQLPAVVSAQANDGGFAIYRVTKVQQPAQADPKLRANQARQVADLSTQAEAAAYFESVKERAGVKQINSVK
jgi:peptidyl-prolyl cis-trans isomerase D